jgi:hypothetical protein
MTSNRPETEDQALPTWIVPAGFVLGVIALLASVILAVGIPEPTVSQFDIFRTITALGGAAFSMSLSGFVTIKLNLPYRGYIVAGGAGAVFVILYFFSPSIPGLPKPKPLPPVVSLGNTGVEVSTTLRQTIAAVVPELDHYVEGQHMLAALDHYPPLSGEAEDSIHKIQSALAARADLLDQLNQVYVRFVALASYDASGQIYGALSSLDGAINNYSADIGAGVVKTPGISSDAEGIFSFESKRHVIRRASEEIVLRLTAIIDLLLTFA